MTCNATTSFFFRHFPRVTNTGIMTLAGSPPVVAGSSHRSWTTELFQVQLQRGRQVGPTLLVQARHPKVILPCGNCRLWESNPLKPCFQKFPATLLKYIFQSDQSTWSKWMPSILCCHWSNGALAKRVHRPSPPPHLRPPLMVTILVSYGEAAKWFLLADVPPG